MTHASLDRPAASHRALPEFVVDRLWRFFCSVRAAVAEIAFLALLVLIGTLRGSSVPRTIADTLPFTTPLVDRWYAWDVFRSLPFVAILTVLAVAIAICTMNRAPGIWQAIARPTVITTHGFIRNTESSVRFSANVAPVTLATQLEEAMRGAGYRALSAERNGEIHLYGDRWRFSRLATFPFHLALIMILLGGIVGARWGFRDDAFIIPEGSVRELGHGTGVSVRLDDFSEVYREDGSALEYRSDVTILKNAEPIHTGAMTVNNPLTFGDIVFYQSGFGQAIALKVEDSEGRVLFDDALPLGPFQSRLNPDAPAARMDLTPAGVALSIVAPDANPANAPEMDTLQLRPGQMFFMIRPLGAGSPIETPIGATVSQGESIELGDLSLTFVREKRFSVLQAARNPGIPIFLAAAVLLIGGLAITFYFPHRRVRGIVSAAPGGSVAHLAPVARRDWSAQRVFEQLSVTLGERLGIDPEQLSAELPTDRLADSPTRKLVMESLVRLSFYFFTAATLAFVAAAACYLIYAVGRVNVRRATLATNTGTTIVSHEASLEPAALGIGRFATLLAWFGVVFQALSIVLRTIAAGRIPLSNMYEFSSTFILLAGVVYLLFERWYGVRQPGAIVLPLIVAMCAYVWTLPAGLREVEPLIPALQNPPLMTAHVSLAILAYATFAVAFAAAVLFLIADRRPVSWLPSADLLDDLGFRAVTIGFPAMSLVLILGSVWAYRAWGTYWQWDPKETAALFTWLLYGVYLHTRSLRGWRGRRSALILLVAFAAVVFTYFGNYVFGGLHAYGGV